MYSKRISLCLVTSSEVETVVDHIFLKSLGVTLTLTPYLGGMHLVLSSKEQRALLEAEEEIQRVFPSSQFFSPTETVEEALHEVLVKSGKSLIVAESCTGGKIASKLIQFSQASIYFLGSLVVYSNELKQNLLRVPSSLLEKHGAVSLECIEAMISGLFQLGPADIAIATSGIAGPLGGSTEKPVGTVYVGVAIGEEKPFVSKLQLEGTREEIIEAGANIALGLLYRNLVYGVEPWIR